MIFAECHAVCWVQFCCAVVCKGDKLWSCVQCTCGAPAPTYNAFPLPKEVQWSEVHSLSSSSVLKFNFSLSNGKVHIKYSHSTPSNVFLDQGLCVYMIGKEEEVNGIVYLLTFCLQLCYSLQSGGSH